MLLRQLAVYRIFCTHILPQNNSHYYRRCYYYYSKIYNTISTVIAVCKLCVRPTNYKKISSSRCTLHPPHNGYKFPRQTVFSGHFLLNTTIFPMIGLNDKFQHFCVQYHIIKNVNLLSSRSSNERFAK